MNEAKISFCYYLHILVYFAVAGDRLLSIIGTYCYKYLTNVMVVALDT